MNEIEKIQSLKAEIKEKHEKIKKSMILLVQMLGGEVEPVNGQDVYKRQILHCKSALTD